MRNFNLVKSLTRVINNTKGLLILCLSIAVFGVESAWGKTWIVSVGVIDSKGGSAYAEIWKSPAIGKESIDETSETTKGAMVSISHNETGIVSARYGKFIATAADGYTFSDWYNASSQAQQKQSTFSTSSTKDDITWEYYAKFTPITYKITYSNVEGASHSNPSTYTVEDAITFSAASKTGYTFNGWSLPSIAKGSIGDKSTSASWSANQYKVTYDAQEGLIEGEDSKTIQETYDAYYTCPTPTREGYDFQGWFTETSGGGTQITTNTQVKITTTQTLYAHWQIVNVVVKPADEAKTVNFTNQTETLTTTLTFSVEKATSATNFNWPTSSNAEWEVPDYSYSNNVVTVTLSFTATENVTTRGDHSSTITLTGKNGESAIGVVTAHVAMTPVLTDKVPTNKLVDDAAIDLNTLWTSSSNGVKTYTIKNWTPEGGKHNGGAVTPSINGSTLSLGDAGTLVLQLSQAAGTSSEAITAEHTLTISRRDNHISINGSQNSYQTSIYMDSDAQISLTATNTDYSGSPITATQTAGNTIAALNAAQTQVTSNHNLGDATWSISQPENYKYKAANATLTVNVVKQAEATDCYVKNLGSQTLQAKFGNETNQFTWTDQNCAGTLSYQVVGQKVLGVGSVGNSVQAYQLVNGSWIKAGSSYDDYSNDNYTYHEVPLDQTAQGFYFTVSGSYASTLKDICVTRKTYLNAANVDITKTQSNNPIYPGEAGVGTLTINHSLANGGDLKVKWDNAKFTIDGKTAVEGINLGDKGCSTGITNLAVNYVSQEAGEHKTTVVIYYNVYRATATITGTTNKNQQTITWKENIDILTAGTDVENPASSTVGNVTYTSSDTTVISVEGNTIHALKAGKATITAFSAGNAYYADTTEQKEITVTDDKVQYILWNQSLTNLKLGGEIKTLTASAQSDVEGCKTNGARQITYVSSNDKVVKIVNNNQLQIVGVGIATVTAAQAGGEDEDGHTYIPVSMQKKAVVRDPDAACVNYIYEQPSEWSCDLGWSMATTNTKTYEIDFGGLEPGYFNLDYMGKSHDVAIHYYEGKMYVEEWINNNWRNVKEIGEPSEDQYFNTGDIALSRGATKMRFRATGKAGYFYFKDCTVTLARYLEATNTLNTFEAKVKAQHKQTLTIKYSNIEGPLTLKLTSGTSFSINKEEIEGECGSKGTADIVITYFPKATNEEETDVLTITDGKNSTLVINLTGSASKTERHIVWEQEPAPVYTVETVTFNAEGRTNLDEVAGEVYYTLAQNSTAKGSINGNTLSFSKFGTAYVAVNTKSDDKYTDAVAITKTWTVNLTPTEIVTEPQIDGEIVYGAQLTDLKLKAGIGAARNTVNQQAVDGTFAITSGDISTAGEHSITITFTPANTDMYAPCTKDISVTVLKATPDATASAGNITYGQKVNESVLSNSGTDGTWTWAEDEKDKVLAVGTHEGLKVHFTPTDKTNYNEIDGTVSLTVNKAAATLRWTSAPTEADVKEQLTYQATSNHSESAITYAITEGNDCATIDANTGVLTITKAGTITVQASQAATDNYEEATISVNTTLSGEFESVFTGEGDWNNPNNWTHGVPTSSNPDVVISGNMTIDESISVGSLTIEANGSVTIIVKGDLTVNGKSKERDAYGDLFVHNGGNVTIGSEASVTVHDFVIEASIGTQNGTSQSGQVDNGDNVIYTNGAYIDINMDPSGNVDPAQWYGFTVPFQVDAKNGVSRKEGDIFRPCTYGVDYMIAEYDMNQRLSTGKGWKFISDYTLQAGHFYYLTIDGTYNTYRFKAKNDKITIEHQTTLTTNGTGANANWNAVGNTTLTYATISGNDLPDYVQTYINGQSCYQVVYTQEAQFVVGCPFFFQAKENTTMVLSKPTGTASAHYAPRQTDRPICVRIAEEGKRFSDQMYISASEDAQGQYQMGRDLAKAGVGTKSAQLWVNAYDQQLCVNDAPLVANQAFYDMSLFIPKAGNYEISLPSIPTNGTLYLTQDGYPFWNLNEGSYVLELGKGTISEYGLMFEATQAAAPTDVQTISGNDNAQKILKEQSIYIYKNGNIFNVTGQKVK